MGRRSWPISGQAGLVDGGGCHARGQDGTWAFRLQQTWTRVPQNVNATRWHLSVGPLHAHYFALTPSDCCG